MMVIRHLHTDRKQDVCLVINFFGNHSRGVTHGDL